MAPEDVGEADADAEGLARRAARQDRFGARQARVLAERQDDPVRHRHRIIIIVGPGPAVDEEGLAITLAAAVDEDEVVGDHAVERRAILPALRRLQALGEGGEVRALASRSFGAAGGWPTRTRGGLGRG